ncbi:hypothetical protein D3C74_49290 [compost metagenome]
MRKLLTVLTLSSIVAILAGCGEAEQARLVKDRESADTGLDRVITLYDQDGKVIKSWQGKTDVEVAENKVKFDLNGKRIIVYNGIVVAEEK